MALGCATVACRETAVGETSDPLQSMQKVWTQAKATPYMSPIPSSKFIDASFSREAK